MHRIRLRVSCLSVVLCACVFFLFPCNSCAIVTCQLKATYLRTYLLCVRGQEEPLFLIVSVDFCRLNWWKNCEPISMKFCAGAGRMIRFWRQSHLLWIVHHYSRYSTIRSCIRSIAFVRWRMHSRPTFEISDRFQLQAVIIKLAKHYGRHAWIADIHRCSAWMTQLITGRPQLTTKRFGPVSSNYVHLADCNRLKASDLFSWFAYNDVALT